MVRLDKFAADVDAAEALNADAVTIGVTAGTTSTDTAAQQFPLAQITEFPTHEEAARALMDGRTMAFVGSTPFPELLVAAAPEQLAIGGEEPLRTTVEAFALPQGEPILLTFLDNWIDAVSAEGFIASSRLEWFDAEPPEEPAAPARPVPQ